MLPRKLKQGDTVGIITPSNPITPDKKHLLDDGIKKLEELGLKVILPQKPLKTDQYGISGGEPQDRANDLNQMFSNPEVKAIWCAHGGDTANQILDLIDYKLIEKNPKIFIGMSDIDVLHLAINKETGLITFNGADPKSGRDLDLDIEYTWNYFQERLFRASKRIKAATPRQVIRKGLAEGKLLGCNLSSILKLAGTKYFPDFLGAVLFLEGYTLDKKTAITKLQQLKQIGVFDKINGLVIGYIYGFQDPIQIKENNIDVTFESIVLDLTAEYDFPIIKTNDFGHNSPNCFLPIGAKVRMGKNIHIISNFLK